MTHHHPHKHLGAACPRGTPAEHLHREEHHGEQGWEGEVRAHVGANPVVLGVGSTIKGDDGAGPMAAEGLAARGMKNAFNCGGVPENFVAKVEKVAPTDVIFVDVVDFDEEPGTIEFFGGDRFDAQSFSTHSAGLSPLMDFLSRSCSACCWVISIQPERLGYSTELSGTVKRAVEEIVSSDVWLRWGAHQQMRGSCSPLSI